MTSRDSPSRDTLLNFMMKLVVFLILAVVFSFSSLLALASPDPRGLYLSYEQRVILSYFIAGAGESSRIQDQIYDRFFQQAQAWASQPLKIRTVRSFDEFLSLYRGEWPDTHSLELDLEILEKQGWRGPQWYKGATAKLDEQIQQFVARQTQGLLQRFHGVEGLPKLLLPVAGSGVLAPELLQAKGRKAATRQIFDAVHKLMLSEFDKMRFLGMELAQERASAVSGPMFKFLVTAIDKYFSQLSLKSKKLILGQILGQNLKASTEEAFETLVMNSGPQFQKLLQVVAREAALGDDLLRVFRQLESKVRAVPAFYVRELFEKERTHFDWLSYDEKPIGVGTMAQVHRGQLRENGRKINVVIRFLKPGIEERVEEDRQILEKLAVELDNDPELRELSFPKIAPIVEGLTQTVLEELQMQNTIDRQKQAREIYNRSLTLESGGQSWELNVDVPRVLQATGSSALMVQELVPGQKLDEALTRVKSEQRTEIKRQIVEAIAGMWIGEILTGSGFFHSDLHHGNFLVSVGPQKITISILDFGMGGVISEDMRAQFTMLAAGAEVLEGRLIAQALWGLSAKQKISRADFDLQVQKKIEELKQAQIRWAVDKWTSWSLEQGLRFPEEFVGANRGMVILDKLLADAGSPLSVMGLGKRMAMKNLPTVVEQLRSTGHVTWMDIFNLGLSTFRKNKSPYQNAASSFKIAPRCQRLFLSISGLERGS